MLQSLSIPSPMMSSCDVQKPSSFQDNLWSRNEKDDMKEAIDLLYSFKEKLGKLHPNCINLIEQMLQNRHYR